MVILHTQGSPDMMRICGPPSATKLTSVTLQHADFAVLTSVRDSASRFYGNSAYAGGGLFETLVEGAVSQCAFEDNMAGNSGGGLSMSEGGGNIDNSIFINNQARRWLRRCTDDHARLPLW